MTNNKLTIEFLNLDNNLNETVVIKASNIYMLINKYLKFVSKNIYINYYNLTNAEWEAGNRGMNAGAFLHEILEEMNGAEL